MFIDSHCHLDFPEFDADRERVFAQAASVGVTQFLVPATTYQSWDKVYQLKQANSAVRIAYGIHPYFLVSQQISVLDKLEQRAAEDKVIAIGEVGLDFGPKQINSDTQLDFLNKQLDIAQNLNLPVVLHARKSYDQLFSILKKYRIGSGVIHAFSGSEVQAKRFLDIGFLLGIGGVITYPRGHKLRSLLSHLSDDSFLLETDSPDMPVFGYQGQRNVPERIVEIAQIVAEVRQQDLERIAFNGQHNILKAFPRWNVKEE